MTGFVVAWALLVALALIGFTALESVRPRHARRPGAGTVALACGLMGVNAALGVALARRGGSVDGAARCATWLLLELGHYGAHRAMHRVPMLWRFHRLHHDPRRPLTWASAWLVHPVDAAIFVGVALAATALGGGDLATSTTLVAARRLWTVLLHANVRWPASPLDRVLATPAFHARHHDEARGARQLRLHAGAARPRAGHGRVGRLAVGDSSGHRRCGARLPRCRPAARGVTGRPGA
jgi:sterol desaturase/sphingolipid hydroxylase (fatty acid hydroxylase superfamily)